MSELTMEQIQNMIEGWLSNPEVSKASYEVFSFDDEEITELSKEYNCEDKEDVVFGLLQKDFAKGSNWTCLQRETDIQLPYDGLDCGDYGGYISPTISQHDETKCFLRTFEHEVDTFSSTFTVFVYTDETDSEILAWDLNID